MTSKRLEGKVAVITGATRGVGYSTAELFVEHGAQVLITGRTVEPGEALAEKLGGNAVFLRSDATREDDIKAMINTAIERFGRIDVLFNNAGGGVTNDLVEDLSLEDFEGGMSYLLTSAFLGMKYAIPVMKQQRSGSIINNASIAGLRTGFASTLYSTAKAALIHMGKCTAMEVAEFGVRVNSISLGAIATAIFSRGAYGRGDGEENQERWDKDDNTTERLISHFAEINPLKRAGYAKDAAYGALYLASDDGIYVTGHDLVIDSGLTVGRTVDEMKAFYQGVREAWQGNTGGC